MTASPPHPREEEIVAYVLGVGTAAEREAFARDLAADPALRSSVSAWDERLAPLAAGIAPVAPRAGLWGVVEGKLGRAANAPELTVLRRSRARWRGLGLAASALAAALALALGIERLAPAPPDRTMVAVINRDGALPALIVRVDPASRIVQVRALTAETPPGRSLQLWSLPSGQAPLSIGVLGAGRLAVPANVALDGSTVAVSVEPSGGSPTGAPTGPVVYKGQLVPEN